MKSFIKRPNNLGTSRWCKGIVWLQVCISQLKQNVPNSRESWAEATDAESLIASLQLLHPSSALICCDCRKKLMSSFTLTLASIWVPKLSTLIVHCALLLPDFSCSYWEEILKCCVGAERWTGKGRVNNPREGYQNYKEKCTVNLRACGRWKVKYTNTARSNRHWALKSTCSGKWET